MAVVVAAEDAERFIARALGENLEAAVVAEVTASPRMVMALQGRTIVDISRDFLSSNGAAKYITARVPARAASKASVSGNAADYLLGKLSDLNFCSQRGLVERFDGSIGAGSVLMPFGGKTQLTPAQVMAALLPVTEGACETASVMSFAFDPAASKADPFGAAYRAVLLSCAKLVAAGCDRTKIYMSFQEFFEKLRKEPERWGKPLSALLGALRAQLGLGVAAIGGKDSMSGSFMDLDVPPTLISFAIAPSAAEKVLSPEFKKPGSRVWLFLPEDESCAAVTRAWDDFHKASEEGKVLSAWAVAEGKAVGGLFKMGLGNGVGFRSVCDELLLTDRVGAILAESDEEEMPGAVLLGWTSEEPYMELCGRKLALSELCAKWEAPLEGVFATRAPAPGKAEPVSFDKALYKAPAVLTPVPQAVIPVFPGTNCEYDTARAVREAGGKAKIVLVRNVTADELRRSSEELAAAIAESQFIVIPGGFSGGDEPEGSGKFISAFFRDPTVKEQVHRLLRERDGLMLGICNGFQALIKLGLVPFGEIRDTDADCPTLTFNNIGRHQSRYVTTRVASLNSPWLAGCRLGEEHVIAISHGEGKFVAPDAVMKQLVENGQIAFQYVDAAGAPSMDISANPNGSYNAVEGILSPDGRVLGKMGHTERRGPFVAKNIVGNKFQPLFENGVRYFTGNR